MLYKLLKNSVKKTLIPTKISCEDVLKNRMSKGEEIVFTTKDGIKLSGSWYQGSIDKTVIFSHSFGANRYGWFEEGHDEVIDMIPSIELFIAAGYNVLLFDHRACGESEGNLTYFGKQEALDIQAAFHWVRENKTSKQNKLLTQFVLLGFSSGANATLFAIEQLEKIKGIEIVGILSNIYWYSKMFPKSIQYFTKLQQWLVPSLSKATEELIGFNPNIVINPLNEAAKVSSPLLFVNSKTDMIADVADIKKIFSVVNSYKELLLIDGERFDSYHVVENNTEKIFSFIEKGFIRRENSQKKTAILTIEYQNSWTTKGFFYQLIKKEYNSRQVLNHTIKLLDSCRKKQINVIHAPLILDKNDRYRYRKAPLPARLFKQLSANTWKSEMTKGIYKQGDLVVVGRSSYDACIDSNLFEILKANKIERVILCGFTTDHCVKETYDSLVNKGLNCIIADDCTATLSDKKQKQVKSTYPLLSNSDIYSMLKL